MATTTTLLLSLRTKLQDLGETAFSDYELLRTLESADREIRRLAVLYKPSLLAEPYEGTLDAGADLAAVSPSVQVLELSVEGSLIPQVCMDEFVELAGLAVGTPRGWIPYGKAAIRFCPLADESYPFIAWIIPTAAPLIKDQEMVWPDEFNDLLLDYCVARTTNEGACQEFMSMWHDEIVHLLSGAAPRNTLVSGYFAPAIYGSIGGDYV